MSWKWRLAAYLLIPISLPLLVVHFVCLMFWPILAPAYYFKFGSGAHWDGFTTITLFNLDHASCDTDATSFNSVLQGSQQCRVETLEPFLRSAIFGPDTPIAGLVEILNSLVDVHCIFGVFIAGIMLLPLSFD